GAAMPDKLVIFGRNAPADYGQFAGTRFAALEFGHSICGGGYSRCAHQVFNRIAPTAALSCVHHDDGRTVVFEGNLPNPVNGVVVALANIASPLSGPRKLEKAVEDDDLAWVFP